MNDLTAIFLIFVLVAPSIIVLAVLIARGARRGWRSVDRACPSISLQMAGELVERGGADRGDFASRGVRCCGMLG